MQLTHSQILEYQQNRYPYLMIDYAEKVIPGQLSEGYKTLETNPG